MTPGRLNQVTDTTGRVAWLSEDTRADGIERSFTLRGAAGPVPGALWSPRDTAPRGTVLLFHGGSGHKRSERLVRMGRWLAATAGLAVIAVDGPHHGDRVPAPLDAAFYQPLIAAEGIERVTARMTADWLDTLSALAGEGLANDARVSVFGMSMGARFGLPVAAALGSRLRCGVFGKFGICEAAPLPAGLCAPDLIGAAARAISAPVLYHVQWHDTLFPREGQFELFDAFASADKQLVARPGPHAETHPSAEASWLEFIGRNATATGERSGLS
jgi:dienelactone hydrolase